MTPQRIQRKRTKGWRKPPDAVIVDRTTNWGNPYSEKDRGNCGPQILVDLYRDWITKSDDPHAVKMRGRLSELRGKKLLCWCELDQPCHADVLLELANGVSFSQASREGEP